MVDGAGFEPAAFALPTRRATRLRYPSFYRYLCEYSYLFLNFFWLYDISCVFIGVVVCLMVGGSMGRGGGIFVGCMFLGLGIGMLFGRADAGVLVGMGIGFIASEIYKRFFVSEVVSEGGWPSSERGSIVGSVISISLGFLFVLIGVSLIVYPELLSYLFAQYGRYIGALVIILMGLAFVYSGIVRRK